MPGHTNIMIHEVGHVLGLYHVFKGVSERESCDDPCRETVPSMDTGDLCADTAPTPKSKLCQDPEPTNDTCGFTHFPGAPFSNYMSYTGIMTVSVCVSAMKIMWGPFGARAGYGGVGGGEACEAVTHARGLKCIYHGIFFLMCAFEELKQIWR